MRYLLAVGQAVHTVAGLLRLWGLLRDNANCVGLMKAPKYENGATFTMRSVLISAAEVTALVS